VELRFGKKLPVGPIAGARLTVWSMSEDSVRYYDNATPASSVAWLSDGS